MEFVQIFEYEADRPEDVWALSEEWWMGGLPPEGGPKRVTVVRDRDMPTRYLTIAEFDSYEEAMANNERPETQHFAERLRDLARGEPRFVNLDLVRRDDLR